MNEMSAINHAQIISDSTPSDREVEVLTAVLDLMVEEGDGFSMAKVARRASCSKETLYRWFGDRDGLLTATVKWQAAKVASPQVDSVNLTYKAFEKMLTDFACNWLTVISGDVSIALNRLAISHAGNDETSLGDIVLDNGPKTMQKRLEAIFHTGQKAGFLDKQAKNMFRVFFGLVVADTQIRVLLGDQSKPKQADIQRISEQAVEDFMVLFAEKNQTLI